MIWYEIQVGNAGAQPEIFQGGGDFEGLGHFDNISSNREEKKDPLEKFCSVYS